MNGYIASISWYRFVENNKRRVKPIHAAVIHWCYAVANEKKWAAEFQLPTAEACEMCGITDRETFHKALKDLADFGAIKILQESTGRYVARWVSLELPDFYRPINSERTTEGISEGTGEGKPDGTTEGIPEGSTEGSTTNYKLLETNKTNKPKKARTHEGIDPLVAELPYEGLAFREAWITWVEHRFSKGKKITPQALKLQIKKLAAKNSEQEAIMMIEKAVEHNWDGIYELNEWDIADLAKPAHTTIAQKYTNKNSFV